MPGTWTAATSTSAWIRTQVAISPDKRDMFLTAGITEGEQYKISEVKRHRRHDPAEGRRRESMVDPASRRDLLARAAGSRPPTRSPHALANIGYAFAKVNPIPDSRPRQPHRGDQPAGRAGPARQRAPHRVQGQHAHRRRGAAPRNAPVRGQLVFAGRHRPFQDPPAAPGLLRDASTSRTPPVAGSNDQVDVVFTVKETTSGSFRRPGLLASPA